MTPEQNIKIAEWLGIAPIDVISAIIALNRKFDTWEGFRLIMENGPSRDRWDEFVKRSGCFMIDNWGEFGIRWAIKQDYIGPKLATALIEWTENKERNGPS